MNVQHPTPNFQRSQTSQWTEKLTTDYSDGHGCFVECGWTILPTQATLHTRERVKTLATGHTWHGLLVRTSAPKNLKNIQLSTEDMALRYGVQKPAPIPMVGRPERPGYFSPRLQPRGFGLVEWRPEKSRETSRFRIRSRDPSGRFLPLSPVAFFILRFWKLNVFFSRLAKPCRVP